MIYEVQQTRWDRILRRVSGSIGPGSRVSETLSELFPMIDVERVPGELLLLGGTKMSFGGGSITADVGESPTAMLFNPVDSNHLVTITGIYFSIGQVATVRWGIAIIQRGVTIGTQTFRDTRSLAPSLPVAEVSQVSEVAQAAGTNQVRVLTAEGIKIEDPNGVAVLAPGSGLEIGASATASTIFYSFHWRERPAEESELSL